MERGEGWCEMMVDDGVIGNGECRMVDGEGVMAADSPDPLDLARSLQSASATLRTTVSLSEGTRRDKALKIQLGVPLVAFRFITYPPEIVSFNLPPRRTGFNPRTGSRIFASGNRAGRCRWSAGFLGDLPFSPPLHSAAAPSLQSPSSALKTSLLKAAQISSLTHEDMRTLSVGVSSPTSRNRNISERKPIHDAVAGPLMWTYSSANWLSEVPERAVCRTAYCMLRKILYWLSNGT
ncbi:hypothetical protein PR048_001458 [Dryococelus australis]|uniref:Uncharacterized protein n=1 Tax=Dryococelus australis TaxID=614101 RepID=A0ABQ9IHJ4_9NEOP|nr:hypothetical protein PR048_001458 [Dryococelus australis]